MESSKIQKFRSAVIIPTVFEQDRDGTRTYFDIFSRLLKDRIIFVSGPIDNQMASVVIAQLLYLEKESSKQPIQMFISSPGGDIEAGLAIFDTMQYIKAPVATIALGVVASMAAILLTGGAKGQRYSLPNADIMIHQPWTPGITNVNVTSLKIAAGHMEDLKKRLIHILSKYTGNTVKKVTKDVELDLWMSPQDAKKYGLIDKIITY